MYRGVRGATRRPARRWCAIAIALVVGLLAAGCSTTDHEGSGPDEDLRVAETDEGPDDQDPGAATSDADPNGATPTTTGSDDDPAGASGGEGTAVTTTTPPGTGLACQLDMPASITLWHSLGGDQSVEALDEIVASFAVLHPEIEVEVVRAEGYQNALRLFRETPADQLPDLFMASNNTARLLADSGVFVPPRICTGADPPVLDDLLPVIRSTLTIDDVLWAYPTNVSAPVLVYDSSLLAQLDLEIDPNGPAIGLDELGEMVVALRDSGLAPGGLALYDRSASWLVEQWAVHHGQVLVEPDNGVHGHPVDGVGFVTDEALASLEWARALYDDDLVSWVGLNQSGIDDLLKLIDLAERAAFTVHTSAALGDLVWLIAGAGLPDLEGAELGVAPFPSPVGATGSLVGGGSVWLMGNGDPVVLGAAAHFAEYLMEPLSQATLAAASGYVPATLSAAAHPVTVARWEEFPQFGVGYGQLVDQGGTPAETGMQIGPRVQVQRVLEKAAADVIVGGADARTRLEAAEVEALDLIRRYERDSAGE